jgi:hypothetical protein
MLPPQLCYHQWIATKCQTVHHVLTIRMMTCLMALNVFQSPLAMVVCHGVMSKAKVLPLTMVATGLAFHHGKMLKSQDLFNYQHGQDMLMMLNQVMADLLTSKYLRMVSMRQRWLQDMMPHHTVLLYHGGVPQTLLTGLKMLTSSRLITPELVVVDVMSTEAS